MENLDSNFLFFLCTFFAGEFPHLFAEIRGWIAHRLTNIWGYTAPTGMDIGGPAWLCEHLWEQYAFTLDRDFLARAYPVMKGSASWSIAASVRCTASRARCATDPGQWS